MTDRYLTIYLRDHLAMARAGLEYCRRVIRENQGNSVGEHLEAMAVELEEEAETLTRALKLLDVEPSQLKMAGAWLVEKMGRLKFNGELTRYSPLSRVFELEFMMAATQARRGLWRTLRDGRHMYPELDELPAERLSQRCGAHLETLRELHEKAARNMLEEGWERDEARRHSGEGRRP